MRNKKLTLIELIIVILVLGLLVGLAIPQFAGVKANADVARFKNDIDVLTKAIDESYVKEDSIPLGEKVAITDLALLDVIYASGDSATNLYKVDMAKTSKYHFDLKTKVDADNYFIYSIETGKVFYTKGLVDGDNKTLYTLEHVGLASVKLGANPLVNGMSVPVTDPVQIITGIVPVSSTVEVKVNGTDSPVTVEDVVFEGKIDLMAAAKTKTFTSEVVLSTGMNIITIKVDSIVTNFKINLGQNSGPVTPETPAIKPVPVISMTPEQGLTTSTDITWGYENSTVAEGRTITNVEWEGKQVIYATEGVYTVRLRVQDSTEVWSDWVEKVITVISLSGVKEIATGGAHTLLLMEDGTVKSFGINQYGQLGRLENSGTGVANPVPTTLVGLSKVKSVEAGFNQTFLLMNDGTVMSFGYNGYGLLGRTANTTANPIPTTISGISGVKSIASGDSHTILLMENGNVMSFGYNWYGQLGRLTNNGTENPNPVPQAISGVSGVKSIATGSAHTLLLMDNGSVMSFGYNYYGQLGRAENSGTHTGNPTPTLVQGIAGVKNIDLGDYFSLLLMENGTIMSFGQNNFGQLGKAANTTPNSTPTPILGITSVKSISAGGNHSILLFEDGTVNSFGRNYFGELGRSANNGTNTANPVAATISGVTGVSSIDTGSSHTLLLMNDGSVRSFGRNYFGQLGSAVNNGTNTAQPVPTEIILE